MEPLNLVLAVLVLPVTFLLAQGLARLDDRFGSICMVDEFETQAHHDAQWKDAAAVKHYSQLVVKYPGKQGQISSLIEETFSRPWIEAAARDMEYIVKGIRPEQAPLGRCQYCGTKVTHLKAHCESCGGAL